MEAVIDIPVHNGKLRHLMRVSIVTMRLKLEIMP